VNVEMRSLIYFNVLQQGLLAIL